YAFGINFILIVLIICFLIFPDPALIDSAKVFLFYGCPFLLSNTVFYVFLHDEDRALSPGIKYEVNFHLKQGKFKIRNIKRGASIIGAAGSGKTESIVYSFLQHFHKHSFCGVIHDYKDFELTE